MLEVVHDIGRKTSSPGTRRHLLCHVDMIEMESLAGALIELDRKAIKLRCETLRQELSASFLKSGTHRSI
jgi:hypothetical protein